MGKKASSNRANQLNPNNPAYWSSRGIPSGVLPAEKASLDNRTNQLNPEHPAYALSRGLGPLQTPIESADLAPELEPQPKKKPPVVPDPSHEK